MLSHKKELDSIIFSYSTIGIPAAVSAVLPPAAVPPITDSLQPHKILRGLALTPGTMNTPVSGLPKSNIISMSKCENSVPPALESNPTSHPNFQYFLVAVLKQQESPPAFTYIVLSDLSYLKDNIFPVFLFRILHPGHPEYKKGHTSAFR